MEDKLLNWRGCSALPPVLHSPMAAMLLLKHAGHAPRLRDSAAAAPSVWGTLSLDAFEAHSLPPFGVS